MRISGSEALKLPDLNAQTVSITMSSSERREYDSAKRLTACHVSYGRKMQMTALMLKTSRRWQAASNVGTKMRMLQQDLATLQSVEPSFHVVIFTQFKSTHASVVRMIRRQMPEAKLFEFTGSTACKRRHDYIREFQDTSPPMWGGRREPKVFVITMRAGAVGITLTAASRVYLMEPCLDPAMEVQAAGRIHRLGQSKSVLVKRLACRDTCEEVVLRVHEQIRAGQIAIADNCLPARAVALLMSK